MRYQLLKLLFLGVLFIGHSALAIDTPSVKQFSLNASEKADSLYNEAHRAYSQGKYEKSVELFKESFEYKPKSDVAFNIGLAYEELKNYDSSIKWYKKSLEMGDIKGGG